MNFQQEYIPHEYIELKMPAGSNELGQPVFLLDPNHLHIWPRHSFMLIALPNKVNGLFSRFSHLPAHLIFQGQVFHMHVVRPDRRV